MEANDVVICPSEITKESVEAALKTDKGSEAHLVSFTVQECTKKGDNYATLVARVTVNFSNGKGNHVTSYIVKYNPKRFKALQDFSYISFIKEQVFYQQLLHEIQSQLQEVGQIPLKVPRCFHTSLEENREVIFLEDLRPRGFKMFDRKKGLDVAHTKLILEELARLHAASALLRAKIPDLAVKYPILGLDWLNYADDAKQTMEDIFTRQMDVTKEMLNKIGGYEVTENWLARNKARVLEILENQLERVPPFDVFCHGDCWTNNVLFRYNEEEVPVEVMLLDLQLCRQASLATDLNFLFHTSLEGHIRKSNLETFLDIYHSAFRGVMEAGKSAMPFSRQELRQEYKNRLEYGLLMTLVVNVLVLCDGEINDQDNEGYSDSLRDILNGLISTSSLIYPRFLSVFEEMTENKVIV